MVDSSNKTNDSSRVRPDDAPRPDTPQPKAGPSPFDDVLQQGRMAQLPQQQQTAQQGSQQTRQAATQERRQDTNKNRADSDKERARGDSRSSESDGKRTESSSQRVEAKQQNKEQQQEGGGGQGQGFGRGQMGSDVAAARKNDGKATVGSGVAKTFALELKKQDQLQALDPHHIQQIVNKVVQYFRLRKGVSGETELQIAFQEEIFKGLRLRLTEKDGKVSLLVTSADPDVRRLFESKRDELTQALAQKGITLDRYAISMEA